MHKSHIIALFFLFSFSNAILCQKHNQRWKVNASTLLMFPGVAYERQISKNKSIQVDVLVSPWKSFLGNDARFEVISTELRFYKSEAFKGFYFGPNFGFTNYNLQKWDYWNRPFLQVGIGFLYGATLGYQFQYNPKWSFDFYLGGGYSQSFYKGYNKNTGVRYDSATYYNKSGEFIPYKIGFMASYRFK